MLYLLVYIYCTWLRPLVSRLMKNQENHLKWLRPPETLTNGKIEWKWTYLSTHPFTVRKSALYKSFILLWELQEWGRILWGSSWDNLGVEGEDSEGEFKFELDFWEDWLFLFDDEENITRSWSRSHNWNKRTQIDMGRKLRHTRWLFLQIAKKCAYFTFENNRTI